MLRPLRQKKGQWEILGRQIIEVILALIVFIAALAYGVAVGSDLRIMKQKSARDLSLTIESAEAAPGSVFFSYADAFGFQYRFTTNRVDVYLMEESTITPSLTYYLFPQDSQLKFLFPPAALGPGITEKTVVSMKKSHPNFAFDQNDISFASTNCEKVDTSGDAKKVILLDRTGDESVQEMLRNSVLAPSLTAAGISANYYDSTANFQTVAEASPDAIILEIGQPVIDSNVNILSLPEKKARKLSCLIRNSLMKQNIKTTVLATSQQDNRNMMNPVSLRVEISPTAPQREIISSIAGSIREYFE